MTLSYGYEKKGWHLLCFFIVRSPVLLLGMRLPSVIGCVTIVRGDWVHGMGSFTSVLALGRSLLCSDMADIEHHAPHNGRAVRFTPDFRMDNLADDY